MRYLVRRIHSPEEIEACERFCVDCVNWDSRIRPETYGYMGYWPGRGLFVRMICEESDPLRTFGNHRDPVWRDSAMEVFLAFPEAGKRGNGGGDREGGEDRGSGEAGCVNAVLPCRPADDTLYLNCEVNANGAMYAQYGRGKKNRNFVPERFYGESGCRAFVETERWGIELLIPEWFLWETCGLAFPQTASQEACSGQSPCRFFCNFYKISENPEIEHYLSYSPIQSDTPNFHMPSCFAEAVVEEEQNVRPSVLFNGGCSVRM